MPWRGPAHPGDFPTLGWQVLAWTHGHLPSPADETKPLVFTDEQARRILRWYEIHPVTGEFIRTGLVLEEAKGTGKSPFAGALMLAAFRGPVCFDGWDAEGQPVGVPRGTGGRLVPWIQIAAVSEDQTANTYSALYSMLAARGGKVAEELRVDLGRTRLQLFDHPSALLEPVTASAPSREGQRITDAVLDETHLWNRQNGGVKLAATIRRNLAKTGGRWVETTNAPVVGERSVAERSSTGAVGILHYAVRAPVEPEPTWTDEQLLAALDHVYGDAYWIDRRRILAEIRDPENAWSDSLRYWFNVRTAGGGRAVEPGRWETLARPEDVPRGTRIGLGFDGSVSHDSTFLQACTADGHGFNLGAWERPPGASGTWSVDRGDVLERVAWAFEFYDVGLMLADPPWWQVEVEGWQRQYGERVLALWTNQDSRFAPVVNRWLSAIAQGTHTHDGNLAVSAHVRAARKRLIGHDPEDNRARYVLVKGEDKERIDGAIADALAHFAATTMPEPTPVEPARFISLEEPVAVGAGRTFEEEQAELREFFDE